jgi:hypothetical protein
VGVNTKLVCYLHSANDTVMALKTDAHCSLWCDSDRCAAPTAKPQAKCLECMRASMHARSCSWAQVTMSAPGHNVSQHARNLRLLPPAQRFENLSQPQAHPACAVCPWAVVAA